MNLLPTNSLCRSDFPGLQSAGLLPRHPHDRGLLVRHPLTERFFVGGLIVAALFVAASITTGSFSPAQAQEYPRKPIRVVEDHVASPTFAPALAARSIDLAERGLTGVFHLGGGLAISWFHYAAMILRLAGFEKADLKPTNEREYRTAAVRPKFSALANERLKDTGIDPMPPLEEAVARYLELREKVRKPA